MRFLLCPPTFFKIAYEINPWMAIKRRVNPALASRQWSALKAALEFAGARVDLLEPQADLPDLVFTADAGLVLGRRVLVSRFRCRERAAEAAHFERWFRKQGYWVDRMPWGLPFEGMGDAVLSQGRLFVGHGFRTQAESLPWVSRILFRPVIGLELVDPRFYHLNTCFLPLGGRLAYYPGAFSPKSRAAIRGAFDSVYELPLAEALRFSCNAAVIGRRVIMNPGCPGFKRALVRWGYEPIELDFSEFLKSGGSARCLVLPLD